MSTPYPYPTSNSELIEAHAMMKHFEGGYFAQTVSLDSISTVSSTTSSESSKSLTPSSTPLSAALEGRVHSPWGPGVELLLLPRSPTPGARVDATQIYYLLTPDSYRGRMHMNLHATFHTHHAGRALYTLIRPPAGMETEPEVRRITVGPHVTRGEVTQLFVPGGWWKASEIPEDDLALVDVGEGGIDPADIGCLISEVVVPGWNPEQHQFIDEDKLKAMWKGKSGWETYEKYIRPPAGLEYPNKD